MKEAPRDRPPQVTESSEPGTGDPNLEELEAEHGLVRGIIIGVVVAVPVCVALWIGLIALALSDTKTGLVAPLAMAAGIGILTGLFFGTWAGFVSKTHTLDDLDRRANLHGTDSVSGNRR